MIAIAAKTRIAYITRLGKDYMDITFPFNKAEPDNLCLHEIARVPGSRQFYPHFQLCRKEDVNKEVRKFMKLAFDGGSQVSFIPPVAASSKVFFGAKILL
jgi:hypothetical protein